MPKSSQTVAGWAPPPPRGGTGTPPYLNPRKGRREAVVQSGGSSRQTLNRRSPTGGHRANVECVRLLGESDSDCSDRVGPTRDRPKVVPTRRTKSGPDWSDKSGSDSSG